VSLRTFMGWKTGPQWMLRRAQSYQKESKGMS